MGCIGGADRTFARKSQECLWQDWYISFVILLQFVIKEFLENIKVVFFIEHTCMCLSTVGS